MMLKEDVITYLKDIHEYIVEDVDDIEKLKQDFKEVSKTTSSYYVGMMGSDY